jgi:hypothetical protein
MAGRRLRPPAVRDGRRSVRRRAASRHRCRRARRHADPGARRGNGHLRRIAPDPRPRRDHPDGGRLRRHARPSRGDRRREGGVRLRGSADRDDGVERDARARRAERPPRDSARRRHVRRPARASPPTGDARSLTGPGPDARAGPDSRRRTGPRASHVADARLAALGARASGRNQPGSVAGHGGVDDAIARSRTACGRHVSPWEHARAHCGYRCVARPCPRDADERDLRLPGVGSHHRRPAPTGRRRTGWRRVGAGPRRRPRLGATGGGRAEAERGPSARGSGHGTEGRPRRPTAGARPAVARRSRFGRRGTG